MKLWTWQGSNFCLTTGCVDHSKSIYVDNDFGYVEKVKRLGAQIGREDGQFIFCSVCTSGWKEGGRRKLYALEVPDEGMLGVIRSAIWDAILRYEERGPKPQFYAEDVLCIRKQAVGKYPNDVRECKKYEELLRKEKLERRAKECSSLDKLWEELLIRDRPVTLLGAADLATVLVRFPLDADWIVGECGEEA